MDDSNKADFSICIGALFSVFGQEATRGHLHGYWLGLCDLELDALKLAVAKAIREKDRLPTPAELRKLCGRSQSAEVLAELAWVDVLKAIPAGPYKHIDFEDGVCNAVIRSMGGWPNFVSRFTDSDSENWVRKEFIRAHQNLSHSGVSSEMARPLPGLANGAIVDGRVGDPAPLRIACEVPRPRIRIDSAQNVFARIENQS